MDQADAQRRNLEKVKLVLEDTRVGRLGWQWERGRSPKDGASIQSAYRGLMLRLYDWIDGPALAVGPQRGVTYSITAHGGSPEVRQALAALKHDATLLANRREHVATLSRARQPEPERLSWSLP